MKNVVTVSILILFIISNIGYINRISAHNFSTDDNSSILTLINQIWIQNKILENSILHNSDTSANSNTSNYTVGNGSSNNTNKSYSIEYIKNIENILEDILIAEQSFIVDSDQFYNNTVIALVVANLADEVLRNYGRAYGIPSNIMLSMNYSNINNTQSNSDTIMNLHTNDSHMQVVDNYTSNIVDIPSYYISLATADRMIEIYNRELDGYISDIDYVNRAVSELGIALSDLRKDIEVNAGPLKIMEDIHGRVHPNLQMAFNLSLNSFT